MLFLSSTIYQQRQQAEHDSEVRMVEPNLLAVREELEKAHMNKAEAQKMRANAEKYASQVLAAECTLRVREEEAEVSLTQAQADRGAIEQQTRNLKVMSSNLARCVPLVHIHKTTK
jgi:hypothetical protein